jgi:hypothetical protein
MYTIQAGFFLNIIQVRLINLLLDNISIELNNANLFLMLN